MLHEGDALQVRRADGQRRSYVVSNALQPSTLPVGEAAAGGFLLCHPGSEALIHHVGEWDQLVVVRESEADQGDDVRQDAAR